MNSWTPSKSSTVHNFLQKMIFVNLVIFKIVLDIIYENLWQIYRIFLQSFTVFPVQAAKGANH